MNIGLFEVGILSVLIGIIFLYVGLYQKVRAGTDFGGFSVDIGAIAAVMGMVIMGICFIL
jgi:hypothetical protein